MLPPVRKIRLGKNYPVIRKQVVNRRERMSFFGTFISLALIRWRENAPRGRRVSAGARPRPGFVVLICWCENATRGRALLHQGKIKAPAGSPPALRALVTQYLKLARNLFLFSSGIAGRGLPAGLQDRVCRWIAASSKTLQP